MHWLQCSPSEPAYISEEGHAHMITQTHEPMHNTHKDKQPYARTHTWCFGEMAKPIEVNSNVGHGCAHVSISYAFTDTYRPMDTTDLFFLNPWPKKLQSTRVKRWANPEIEMVLFTPCCYADSQCPFTASHIVILFAPQRYTLPHTSNRICYYTLECLSEQLSFRHPWIIYLHVWTTSDLVLVPFFC